MIKHQVFLTATGDVLQEQYILEHFQRAVFHSDEEAKVQFQHCLGGTVQQWLHLHPQGEMICQLEKEAFYIMQAFERFWQMIVQGEAIDIGTSETILAYLRASLASVILETIRAHACTEMSISMLQGANNQHWEYVQSLLTNARQQRIAYLLFHCGLKPGEIVQAFPEDFSDVAEIDQLRYKIITSVASLKEC